MPQHPSANLPVLRLSLDVPAWSAFSLGCLSEELVGFGLERVEETGAARPIRFRGGAGVSFERQPLLAKVSVGSRAKLNPRHKPTVVSDRG